VGGGALIGWMDGWMTDAMGVGMDGWLVAWRWLHSQWSFALAQWQCKFHVCAFKFEMAVTTLSADQIISNSIRGR
jgi:hypothetical protein